MKNTVHITTFYKFIPLDDRQVARIEKELYALAHQIDNAAKAPLQARGLCILGREGLNATLSVHKDWAHTLKNGIEQILGVSGLIFKDSFSENHPFHKFKIKIRDEIVTLSRSDLIPKSSQHRHLTPEEWHEVVANEDPVIIDTRNSYEYEVGHFKGALDPQTREFKEFPDWVKETALPKDKKILIYCTGGIRCEKAILEMGEQGYSNVYQLEGGILNYLQKFPNAHFDGECFVFDHRVAVNQQLEPSEIYKICPHCGQPGQERIDCVQCGVNDVVVCERCLAKGAQETGVATRNQYHTCSKNCAHHFTLGHKSKRIHTDAFRKRVGDRKPSKNYNSNSPTVHPTRLEAQRPT